MSAALKLKEAPPQVERVRVPDLECAIDGNSRQLAAAKFRELGDRIESGELFGASVEWRDDLNSITRIRYVECEPSVTLEDGRVVDRVQLIQQFIREV